MALLDANLPSSGPVFSAEPAPTRVRSLEPAVSTAASSNETKLDARPTVFQRAVMEEPLTVPCAGGLAVAFSRSSPVGDAPNQDSAAIIPVRDDGVVLAVADGVGGMKAGHAASAAAIRAIRQSVSAAPSGADLRTFILDGIETANARILRQGLRAATTVAVVDLSGGFVRPYHVGDSIILQVSGRGDIKWSALSHAPVSYAVEAGVMTEEDAMVHPERNLISNVVGDRDMWIEIGPRRKLAATDTIVVASDGLCDNLSTAEIADLTRRSPLAGKVASMIDLARHRMQMAIEGRSAIENVPGKPDDLTALVYRRERRKGPRKGKAARQPQPTAEQSTGMSSQFGPLNPPPN